jgi:hypothetical protein
MKSYSLYLKDRQYPLTVKLDQDPDTGEMSMGETSVIALPSNGGQVIIKSSEFVALIPETDSTGPRVTAL